METPIRPPFDMASRALTARFISTCCIWLGSTLTRPVPCTGSTTSCMSSPIIRCNMGTRSATSGPSSSTRGCTTCLRLKARSWLVSATARCEVFWIRSTSRCIGSPGLSRLISMWARRFHLLRLLELHLEAGPGRVRALLLGEIPDIGIEGGRPVCPHHGHGQLHRELGPVGPPGAHLDAAAQERVLAGRQVVREATPVCVPEGRRDDHLRQLPADDVRPRVPK